MGVASYPGALNRGEMYPLFAHALNFLAFRGDRIPRLQSPSTKERTSFSGSQLAFVSNCAITFYPSCLL